jgi:hypothetical protein
LASQDKSDNPKIYQSPARMLVRIDIYRVKGGCEMPKVMKKVETKTAANKPVEIKKTGSKKYLAKVPETMVFWCHDGQVFNDLDQLIQGFDLMSDDTFMYHANEDKNDFSCWILDVIGDADLSEVIKKARTKADAKKITEKRKQDLSKLDK